MAVGTIASISVTSTTSNSVTLSWTKPANTTKFTIGATPKNLVGASIGGNVSSSAATGTKITYTLTGLSPNTSYYLYVTPYNGSTPGTTKQYVNSGTGNTFLTKTAVTSPTTTTKTTVPSTSSSTSTSTAGTKVSTATGTPTTTNGATTAKSDGATNATPDPSVAGSTVGTKPSTLNNPNRQSKWVSGLNPKQTYSIKIYAETTDADGNLVKSEYSQPLIINTPYQSASGNNFSANNSNTDIRLVGGSLFATDPNNPFSINAGLVDVVNDSPVGNGVILNQTGLVAMNNGSKQFYLDARTGKAYFAGNLTAGTVKIGPGVDPTGTKNGIFINAQNYWYEDGSWSAKGSDIKGALTGTDLPKPKAVTNVATTWSGTDFKITFDDDVSDSTNSALSYFLIELKTASFGTYSIQMPPNGAVAQSFVLSLSQNRAGFGVPQTSFLSTSQITPVDTYGNKGTPTTFTSTPYVTPLSTPTITVQSVVYGYTVNFGSQPTGFSAAVIEEAISPTQPASGSGLWTVVSQSPTYPSTTVYTTDLNLRWVRVKLYDQIGGVTSYSNVISVSPASAVGADTTPPNAPTTSLSVNGGIDSSSGATIGFNGYLDLSWGAVSDSTLRGYRIRFRTSGSNSSYSYVDSPGTGTTYRLGGLAVGATYEIGIASYDEYNNTSSAYSSFTSTQVSGTPFVGTNVNTTGYFSAGTSPNDFQFGYGIDSSNNSGTFSGTKRGLYFNSSNYWVIDSNTSAKFKVGGPSANYLLWDGTKLYIDGNLQAKGGYFSGNVEMKSGITGGASIYSGTLDGNGNLSGNGYILNSSGLVVNGSNGSTTVSNTAAQTLITTNANIGGWLVGSSTISKTSTNGTITLDASNNWISFSNLGGYYVHTLGTPTTASNGQSYITWVGLSNSAADISNANFKIAANGNVEMNNASVNANGITSNYLKINNNGIWDTANGLTGINNITSSQITSTTGNFGSGYFGRFTYGGTGLFLQSSGSQVTTTTSAASGAYETFEGNSSFAMDGYQSYGNSTSISTYGTLNSPTASGYATGQFGYYWDVSLPGETYAMVASSSYYPLDNWSVDGSGNGYISTKFYAARSGSASGSSYTFNLVTEFYDSSYNLLSTSTTNLSPATITTTMTQYTVNNLYIYPGSKYVRFTLNYGFYRTSGGGIALAALCLDGFWWRADNNVSGTYGSLPTSSSISTGSPSYYADYGTNSGALIVKDSSNSTQLFLLNGAGQIPTITANATVYDATGSATGTTSVASNAKFVRAVIYSSVSGTPTVSANAGDLLFTTG